MTRVKKHPKTVEKWLNKMKLSVLKKISLSSRILFRSKETNPTEIKKQINQLISDIKNEKNLIVESGQQFILNNLPEVSYLDNNNNNNHISHELSSSQNTGLFADQVNQINEKIDIMANRISTLSKDLGVRLTSLGDLIQTVQTSRKTLKDNDRYVRQTRSMGNRVLHQSEPTKSSSTSISTISTTSAATTTSSSIPPKKLENPLQAFGRVLNDS